MRRWGTTIAPIVFIAALLGGWEAVCWLFAVPAYFLPKPSEIGVALATNAPSLFASAWLTFSTALIAFVIVIVIAGLAALAAAANDLVEASFRPIAVTLQVTPIFAIAPMVAVWAGVDHPDRAVISLAAVAAFFPIYSGALAGLRSPDPELVRLFDLYGATLWQRLSRLQAPSAVPQALEGLKVGLGLSLIGAVVAELAAGSGAVTGLAWRIAEASHRLEMAESFAALAALAMLAAGLQLAFLLLEQRALAWWRGR
ncbi:MAG TPA: ABC transporter permease subunit [Caulobacteraceae bacterium]|jgi:NitT/TauT family transport system permease protein